jgi:hypothetical protein
MSGRPPIPISPPPVDPVVVPRKQVQVAKATRPELLDELLALGLPGTVAVLTDRANTTVTVLFDDEAQRTAIVNAVAAHSPAPYVAAEATAAQQGTDDAARIRAAYQAIKDTAASLRADAAGMPPTLTDAQVRARLIQFGNAVADQGEALAALLRIVGRRVSG